MVRDPEDFTIGRIWLWKGYSSRKDQQNTPKPDVILPYGYLYETEISLVQIATKMNQVAILPNCDLIIGPEFLFGGDETEKNRIGLEAKEFKADVVYLKKAIEHGTIDIERMPKG